MHLNSKQLHDLKKAIDEYSYPKVLYDFLDEREVHYISMRELESVVRTDLKSGNPDDVKRGLSNILYWGHRTSGYYWTRVKKFRSEVKQNQLNYAAQDLIKLNGPGLLALKRLDLPQFSNVTFLSKVRMFVDPDKWVVLDRQLVKKLADNVRLFQNVNKYETYIPCTPDNERQYSRWCAMCRWGISSYFPMQEYIAVDVERGIYQLVTSGQTSLAAEIATNLDENTPLLAA